MAKTTEVKETPLMKQYNDIKGKYPDAILLFRVGDFYETFGEDAIKAATILGITLDAFRMGAGALLFLTAIDLVKGVEHHSRIGNKHISQLAVVPLAIPMTIGPGTTGILLLMGASFNDISNFITESLALLSAVLVIGLMLFSSTLIEAIVGKEGLQVISKITGLFLAALSAQIMFTGVKNFLGI